MLYKFYIYIYFIYQVYCSILFFFRGVLCAALSGRPLCWALAQSRNQVSLLKKIYSWQLHTHNVCYIFILIL
jgi:hypothetical protein